MLTQSFTTENFRDIFDFENRRGINLEAKFFPGVEKVTNKIRESKSAIREFRRKKPLLSPEVFELEWSSLIETQSKLKTEKERLLNAEFDKIAAEIAAGNFQVGLNPITLPSGKKAYAIDETAHAFFIVKQLERNIHNQYSVKQSSRYELVCQLRAVLADKFPKYVVRTDLRDFYESISRERLLKIIDDDALLTLTSRKIIKQILGEYGTKSGSALGVPRGVGISAYLSELYIQRFDDTVKVHEELVFYGRYVDDIVMIFSPRPSSAGTEYLPFIKGQVENLGLDLNPDKTTESNARGSRLFMLEYLGYKIVYGDGSIKIGISDRRKKKYETRINRSFDAYDRGARFNEKKAGRLLIKRIRFLTGNTRLFNSKGNILTGVFYSNSLLSDSADFKSLDELLADKISRVSRTSLKQELQKLSFQNGFEQRRYSVFTTLELSRIVEVWKHER